jgi:tRNA pseudouridine55 synthase
MKSENRSNFYLINKPKTWTSQDLCSKFKYLYRFNKVGHAGTLDPNAEGLMLLATDKYTKLFNYTKETDKTYQVSALFGHSSDSIDTDTEVIKNEDIDLSNPSFEIESLINTFLGTTMQKPPM